jgi:hypothetical protein
MLLLELQTIFLLFRAGFLSILFLSPEDETRVDFQWTTQCYIPGGRTLLLWESLQGTGGAQGFLTCKNFCQENLTEVCCDEDFVHNLCMSVEVHLHLHCFMNNQSFHYWSEENPHQFHEQPLHGDHVKVWCAVSSHNIISPYFLEHDNGSMTTVISGCYQHSHNFLDWWTSY